MRTYIYTDSGFFTLVESVYTGCPRRNLPDFGRVFPMLKYTDVTQNTYVHSWTVKEIMAREKCGLLAVPRTVLLSWRGISVCPWLRFAIAVRFISAVSVASSAQSAMLYQCDTYTYLLTYGAEPFLRSPQLWNPSRASQHFMEPEGSIPCSREPSTDPYPEPYQSNPLHPILSL
jgi:hypothetical protein